MVELGNFGERHEPKQEDWGHFAHLSIYRFALQFAKGRAFLDVGCGTGYGIADVLRNGARIVRGTERNVETIEELAKRYPGIDFQKCDLNSDRLPADDAEFDVVFSSNVFEHVAYIDPVIRECARVLKRGGSLIVAVPPVSTVGMLYENAKNIFHINNLPHQVWRTKLNRFFASVEPYRHWVVAEKVTSGHSIAKDNIRLEDFIFEPRTTDTNLVSTITEIYLCRDQRHVELGPETEASIPADWKPLVIEANGRIAAFIELNQRLAETEQYWKKEITALREWTRGEVEKNGASETMRAILAHLDAYKFSDLRNGLGIAPAEPFRHLKLFLIMQFPTIYRLFSYTRRLYFSAVQSKGHR